MTGTSTEEGFHVLPAAMQQLASPLVLPVFAAPGRLLATEPTTGTTSELAELLRRLAQVRAACPTRRLMRT